MPAAARADQIFCIFPSQCGTFRISRKNLPVTPVFSRHADAVRSANLQVMPFRLQYESRFPRKSRITSKRFEVTTIL